MSQRAPSTPCAILATGSVECWGSNGFGQLGDGTTMDHPVPVSVNGITNATSVTVGESAQTCAVLATGAVDCWGNNENGQLGNGTNTGPDTCGAGAVPCHKTPGVVSNINTATGVSAGAELKHARSSRAVVSIAGARMRAVYSVTGRQKPKSHTARCPWPWCRPRVWGNRAGVASALTDKSKLMEVHPHEEGSPQRTVAPRA